MISLRQKLFDDFICTKNGAAYGNCAKVQVHGNNFYTVPCAYSDYIAAHVKADNFRQCLDWTIFTHLNSI